MTEKMYDYYRQLQNEGIILYFNGPVSQAVVEGIADLMREKMRHEEAGMSVTQRVFAILIEQMQNIVRYSTERNNNSEELPLIANGQIIVGREDGGEFYVACGNKIRSEDGPDLHDKLTRVQGMNKDELRAFYKDQRRKGPDPDSRGAGLGFIEMARKSTRPLDFDIVPIDRDTSFFSMKVVA